MKKMNNRANNDGVYVVDPGSALVGEMGVPGDKSLSHRVLMLGALAEGETVVDGWLESEDCLRTLEVLEQLGVSIERPYPGRVVIHGVGLRGFKPPEGPLDFGNSGTGLRLMVGVLAGQGFDVVLTGDESLQRRPMERIVGPLNEMGARVEYAQGGTPPLYVMGSMGQAQLRGIDYTMPIASAQVKSCLLLAGLFTDEDVVIKESGITRDHTERLLGSFGVTVEKSGNCVKLVGNRRLTAANVQISGDFSSAAFFIVAATLSPGSDLLIKQVGVNPTRIGLVPILRKMGADIIFENESYLGTEPLADIRVKYAELKGIEVPKQWVASAIDELPVLAIAAAFAKGKTHIRHAGDLKYKESDRIKVMATGLRQLGIEVQDHEDGLTVLGSKLQGGVIDSHFDHRVAMSFTIGGHCGTKQVIIRDTKNVATSFPNFVATAQSLGMEVQEKNEYVE